MKLALVFCSVFLACALAQEESDKSAWDYLITSPTQDYTLFESAVRATGYSGVLANHGGGRGGITVFAPNDDAFVATAKELGYSGDDKNGSFAAIQKVLSALNSNGSFIPALYQIIGYHVVAGGYSPEMLASNSSVLMTYSGNLIATENSTIKHTAEGVLTNPTYTTPIYVSNGIIYGIDRILVPFLVDSGQTKDIINSAAAATAEGGGDDTTRTAESDSTNNVNTGDGGRSVCFPADEKIRLRDGTAVSVEDLRAGDEVMVNEAGETSPVFAFTHKMKLGIYDFVRIQAEGDMEIVLSAKHYIYSNGQATPAENVSVGDVLRTIDGPRRALKLEHVRKRGLFAPHSIHGDIVVGGIVASCYTELFPRDAAHAALVAVRSLSCLGVKEPLGNVFYSGFNFRLRLRSHLSYLRFLVHFRTLISS